MLVFTVWDLSELLYLNIGEGRWGGGGRDTEISFFPKKNHAPNHGRIGEDLQEGWEQLPTHTAEGHLTHSCTRAFFKPRGNCPIYRLTINKARHKGKCCANRGIILSRSGSFANCILIWSTLQKIKVELNILVIKRWRWVPMFHQDNHPTYRTNTLAWAKRLFFHHRCAWVRVLKFGSAHLLLEV